MHRVQHICHITSAHPVSDTRIFHRECVSLRKSGFNVTLVAPAQKNGHVQGIQIVPLPRTRIAIIRRLVIPWLAAWVAVKTKADLYHFHDPELIPAMRWLASHSSKPIIWDVHENYVDTIQHYHFSRSPNVGGKLTRWFDKIELSTCREDFAGVVTITETMAQRYKNINIPTCILSNYFDLRSANFLSSAPCSKTPRIINTGSLFLERGVMEMADAFILLRQKMDCQIALWGNFQPPSLAEEILKRVMKEDVVEKDDVKIGGPYPWKTLVEKLIPTGWAGCVLLDLNDRSASITHANRLFEYWANKLPVITNKGTESAKIVEEIGGGILIDSLKPQEIADAFSCFVMDRGLAEKMGNAGRRAVEEKYNWDNIFPNLLEFYAKFGVYTPED